jgi:hypothetical protein
MKTLYLLLLLAVIAWKGYYAWRRGVNAYRKDLADHGSLREYLLGNGATDWQAHWPYYRHALLRALVPLKAQWRLWLLLLALGLLVVWID